MSFPPKFKAAGSGANDTPVGVNIEHTSFGYQQNQKPYVKPSLQPTGANVKTKPRGGWDDDEEDNDVKVNKPSGPYRGNQTNTAQSANTAGQGSLNVNNNRSDSSAGNTAPVKKTNTIDFELMQCDEQFVSQHEFENKTINDLIQPGGARVKQPDNVLANFCRAAESFQVAVVSSLLLSKLFEDIPFVSKMRTLYLLETVVKKVKKYFDCIKHNLHILKDIDYSGDGQNAPQLAKVTQDIIKYIEEPNQVKPQVTIPANISSPTKPNTSASLSNVANDTDLLGVGSTEAPAQNKGKVDAFGFLQKQSSAPLQTTNTSNAANFDLIDLTGGSLPTVSQQNQGFQNQGQGYQQNMPFNQQQQQQQAAPKKFNPFEVAPQQNVQQNVQPQTQGGAKPGLNFKKFQGGATPTGITSEQSASSTSGQNVNYGQNFSPNTPNTNQNLLDTHQAQTVSKFDQLDNLLENFESLDLLGNKTPVGSATTPSNTGNFNTGNTPTQQFGQPNFQTQQNQNQGFQNQQNFNQNQQGGFGNKPNFQGQPSNQNQGQGFNYGQQNQGFQNQNQGQFNQNFGNQQQNQPQGQFNQNTLNQYNNQNNQQFNAQHLGGFGQQQQQQPQGNQFQGYGQNSQNQQVNRNVQQGFGGPQQQQQFNQNQGFGYGQQQQYQQQQFGQGQGQFGGQGNFGGNPYQQQQGQFGQQGFNYQGQNQGQFNQFQQGGKF